MENKYQLIFDEVILKQLKKIAKDKKVKDILSKMFDKLELAGHHIGELLDSKLFIYEMKNKHPPLRLYFKHNKKTDEIYLFEFEMKTSDKKQNKTINRIRTKLKS